jgi:5-methylcytosine-specific restriction endonuclease McrA
MLGLPYENINRMAVFERDDWTCGICHEPVDRTLKYPDPGFASIDHIIPVSRGGSHTYDNVWCAHLRCNLSKRDKLLENLGLTA